MKGFFAALRRRGVSAQALLLAAMASAYGLPARADYPERPISAIVPFTTGGTSDILARLFSANLSKELNQPVIVENKPGAGGNIGINAVALSKPDGYTILLSSIATTQNPALYRHLPYDPLKDIQPVAFLAESPQIVAINANKFPKGNLADLIDLIKKNPGKFNFSSTDSGMIVNRFSMASGVQVAIIPYAGSGDAGTALMSGEVDVHVGSLITAQGGLSAGKVRVLAVAGDKRLAALPDVPTASEEGMKGYADFSHFGAYVRTGTPGAVVQKLNTAFNKVSANPEVVDRLRALGFSPVIKSVDEFTTFYLSEIATWKEVVAKGHIPPVD